MMRSYLLKINGKVAERPQHMLMRVALGIHQTDIEAAIETYKLLSEKWFTHASPTLFNAGTCKPQLSSCFLVTMTDDSIDGIYDTLTLCAKISKAAGGIGINVHNIRASGSYIAGVRNHPEDGKTYHCCYQRSIVNCCSCFLSCNVCFHTGGVVRNNSSMASKFLSSNSKEQVFYSSRVSLWYLADLTQGGCLFKVGKLIIE